MFDKCHAALMVSCALSTSMLACNDHPLKEVEYSSEQEAPETLDIAINKDDNVTKIADKRAKSEKAA